MLSIISAKIRMKVRFSPSIFSFKSLRQKLSEYLQRIEIAANILR